jgi:hypothetical protein
LDALKTLPSIPIESTKAGCLDNLKKYSMSLQSGPSRYILQLLIST